MRVGVIGLGDWGNRVAKEYVLLQNEGKIDELYLCDMENERLSSFKRGGKELNLSDIKFEARAEDLIGRVDAVHICTPNTSHYSLVKKMLENNIHVLVEKPMTQDVDTAKELVELAEKKGLLLKTGLIFRFSNSIRKLREMYETGVMEDVYFFDFEWHANRNYVEGVDVVWDLMPHLIDMFEYITGGTAQYVAGQRTAFRREALAEQAHIVLKIGKTKGIFNIGWFSEGKVRKITSYGNQRTVTADILSQEIKYIDKNGNQANIRIEGNNTIRDEALNFIEDYSTGKNNVNAASTALNNIRLLQEIMKQCEFVG